MLESRSAYGYYGVAGGVTGENRPSELDYTITRMPYWKYKSRFSDYKTVSGSYDKSDKTIEVYIPTETIKPSGMRGQNVSHYKFYFEIGGQHFYTFYRAINEQNAERRFKAEARKRGWKPEDEQDGIKYTEYDRYAILIPGDVYDTVFSMSK